MTKATENIVCEGFAVEAFARMTNDHGQDMNDVLEFIGEDIPKYRGFALIVQYGGDFKPKAVYPVPFGYVRAVLNKNYKDNSRVDKWLVFDNWDRSTLKDTNSKKGTVYPTFNPENFAAECEEYGGIEITRGNCITATCLTVYLILLARSTQYSRKWQRNEGMRCTLRTYCLEGSTRVALLRTGILNRTANKTNSGKRLQI